MTILGILYIKTENINSMMRESSYIKLLQRELHPLSQAPPQAADGADPPDGAQGGLCGLHDPGAGEGGGEP